MSWDDLSNLGYLNQSHWTKSCDRKSLPLVSFWEIGMTIDWTRHPGSEIWCLFGGDEVSADYPSIGTESLMAFEAPNHLSKLAPTPPYFCKTAVQLGKSIYQWEPLRMARIGGCPRSTSHIAAVQHASVGPPETAPLIALLPISPAHTLLQPVHPQVTHTISGVHR